MRIFYLFILSIVGFNSWGQINNHWKLGQTDIDFTNSTPIANIYSNSNYAKATMSDQNGNLLFYTDGKTVWNKFHNIMTNGSELTTSTNVINSIIVPNPNNSSQYYIFNSHNLNCLCFEFKPTTYSYSIVEFNISNPNGIVLNIDNSNNIYGTTIYSSLLKDSNSNFIENKYSYGPLTISKNSSGNGYWIIIQSKNKIISYQLNNTGLNLNPIESTFNPNEIYKPGTDNGSVISGNFTSNFKMAPNNQFLIGLQKPLQNATDPPQYTGYFYKLNFDNNTGLFSNYQIIYGGTNLKDFEISNNSNNLIYIRGLMTVLSQAEGEVLIKDLINLSNSPRKLNENNSTTNTNKFSFIEKDRHGNILLSSTFNDLNKDKYLHKIIDQDNFNNSYLQTNFVYLNNFTIGELPLVIPEITPLVNYYCYNPLILNTETNSNQFLYENFQNITTQTNYVINLSTQNITLKANDYILLKPNTYIKSGSIFQAKIQQCNLISNRMISNENNIKFNNELNISLYPNPSTGIYNLVLTKEYINSDIYVYDIFGKSILTDKVKNQVSKLDISNYPTGVYIVKINSSTENKIFKIIKE